MSFFGGGGGGFGQQNTQPTTTFGGFGSTSNTTNTGFGASGGGFGSTTNTNTPSTGLFGGSSGTGFGTSSGGFGSGTSAFGAKPATTAFGTPATTTASTGLFGSSSTTAPATTGFGGGGFGSTATNAASTGFGTGGGLFGSAAKPATGFGATPSTGFGSTTTGGSLFGAGTTSATPAFGATNNPGIGTNVTDPPGTAVTPFSAFSEKEGTSGVTNTYQNILFQDAYKKWSTEELRLADYNQGRRSGGIGGTGTFGASGFGTATGGFGTNTASNTGFGSTGTGMFGNTGATTGFGANNTTTTPAFGATSSTTGGLFGAKPAAPATGGLFGSTTPAQPASGGLFGSSSTPAFGSTTTNAFGANNTATTGGGLFGSANTAVKPAGGLFGGTGTTTAGGGLFGATNTATPGAFGSTTNATTGTTGGLFGSTPAATTTGGGLFGGQTQQPAAGTGFGAGTAFGGAAQNTGGGLFGSAAAKPAGAFGTTPAATTGTTGGLFGGAASTSTPFGGTATAQPAATGGLFGAKPAATGGLFGGSTTAQPATGGLFGGAAATNTQAQQPATGGLFGSSTAAKPGGLFGSTQPTAGGLFGSTTAPATGGAFGTSLAQPQAGGLGSSLFGASQSQQQPQAFSTSINDLSAYGASTLFTNLTDDKIANPGPLATPLSGKQKTRSRSILPMYKLSPANASWFATPRKQGYGFSYSTYGSPSSPSSAASTPGGFGQSLLVGGSIGRSGLSKSISASNLRRSFNVEDSILSPGAFSSSSGPRLLGSSSTHKKLVINRDLRADLFTTPAKEQPAQETNGKHKLSKRVSFETTPGEANNNGQDTIRESIEGGSTPSEDLGYLKPTSSLKSSLRATTTVTNGSQPPSVTATPEMQQVKGNELAIVHEEASPEQTRTSAKPGSAIEPGSYWMSPSLEQIRAMNRVQRSKVDFTIGRENVGSIQFKVPVDLNNVDFENIFDEIVVLVPRSATVYPVAAKKPVVGKGLNVPARISLEHSYPRGGIVTSERKLQRHIERLKASPDTTFEDYDKETGVWTFSVEHFTTYGLDDDDDEDEMTDAEPSVAQLPTSSATKHSLESPGVDPDDTFEFKRSKRAVPGAFDEDAMTDEELLDNAPTQGMSSPEIDDVDVPAQPQGWYDDQSMEDEQDVYQQDIVEQGSQDGSIEEDDDLALGQFATNEGLLPGGIMRARMRAVKKSTAPTRIEVAGGDDWTQILQASVRAPRTVDRVALRALNESGAVWDMQDRGSPAPKSHQVVTDGAGFQTSIDLMKSLFEKPKGLGEPVEAPPARGFVKWPYQKRDKVDAPENDIPPPRPTWGPNELFVATQHNETNILPVDGNEVGSEVTKKQLSQLQQYIEYLSNSKNDHNMPTHPSFRELAQDDPVWELAGLLFDDNGANLAGFWKQMVSETTDAALLHAEKPEEKAIICLAGHRVADACAHLMEARNFRLAGLVASIGSGSGQAKDIRAQLNDWRESNVLSEFSEPIRAIYELLGGNACVCAGVKNVSTENRVSSFTISQRFGLDWLQAFGLRLFYTSSVGENAESGWGSGVAEAAVRSFAADIEQDREPEPDHPLWSLLKIFAFRQFDWSDPRLGWLLTKSIYVTHKVAFGGDAEEKLDMASLKFAASLTATAAASSSSENKNLWVQAAFVLGDLSKQSSKEAAVREHLGRHAHLIGNPKDPRSAFAAMVKFGVPESWIWEAKALHFRSKEDSRQEFLALVWAGNYKEANRAFVERVAPALVIQRDFEKLFRFAELLFKVGKGKPEWEQGGANVYLLYPLAIANLNGSGGHKGVGLLGDDEKLVGQLLDGLVALRAQSHGDVRQEAAIADMAENLIRGSGYLLGNDQKLYGLLPEDVRGKYLRARALETVC